MLDQHMMNNITQCLDQMPERGILDIKGHRDIDRGIIEEEHGLYIRNSTRINLETEIVKYRNNCFHVVELGRLLSKKQTIRALKFLYKIS